MPAHFSRDDYFSFGLMALGGLVVLFFIGLFFYSWRQHRKANFVLSSFLNRQVAVPLFMILGPGSLFIHTLVPPLLPAMIWVPFAIFAVIFTNADLKNAAEYASRPEDRTDMRIKENFGLFLKYGITSAGFIIFGLIGVAVNQHSEIEAARSKGYNTLSHTVDVQTTCGDWNQNQSEQDLWRQHLPDLYQLCTIWTKRGNSRNDAKAWQEWLYHQAYWAENNGYDDLKATLYKAAMQIDLSKFPAAPIDQNTTASTTPVAPQPTTGDLWK